MEEMLVGVRNRSERESRSVNYFALVCLYCACEDADIAIEILSYNVLLELRAKYDDHKKRLSPADQKKKRQKGSKFAPDFVRIFCGRKRLWHLRSRRRANPKIEGESGGGSQVRVEPFT